jgi:purine-binding chemotaxis protein CheW
MSDSAGGLHLVARVDGRVFAVPLAAVVEVMRPQPLRRLADAPAWLAGLSTIRGSTVPVIDAAALLGAQATEPRRLIALRAGARVVALACSAVDGIRALRTETLPPLARAATPDFIATLARADGALLQVLEAARLLDGADLAGLAP